MVRVLCLEDKNPTFASIGDNFFAPESDQNDPVNFDSNEMNMLRNINSQRYKVYLDRQFQVLPNDTANGQMSTMNRKFFVGFKKKLRFNTESSSKERIVPTLVWVMYMMNADDVAMGLGQVQFRTDYRDFFNQ